MSKMSLKFTDKENSHSLRAPPKTPLSSKAMDTENHNNNISHKDSFKTPPVNKHPRAKRIPLGGKDKNSNLPNAVKGGANPSLVLDSSHQYGANNKGLFASNSKRRARRFRTPLSSKHMNKKLNILKDEPHSVNDYARTTTISGNVDSDDEVEFIPPREPEIPYVPLGYEPFTEDELSNFSRISPHPIIERTTNIRQLTEEEVLEEYPISFPSDSSENEFEPADKIPNEPHYMKPTVVSTSRITNRSGVSSYANGLSSSDLYRCIMDDEY